MKRDDVSTAAEVGGSQPPRIGSRPSVGTAVQAAVATGRVATYVMLDRIRRRPIKPRVLAPGKVEHVTREWLNRALRPVLDGARVDTVRVEQHSSGTSVRARLHLTYVDALAGQRPPASMFAKSVPSFTTRLANGLSGTAPCEAGFYNDIRPLLEIDAPRGYYSAFDPRSFRAIQLLEDLALTRGAKFCHPTTVISRDQAGQVVTQLAHLHGSATTLDLGGNRKPRWLRTYPQWWQSTASFSMLHRYHLRGQRHADELGVTPRRLAGRGDQLWRNFEESVDAHRRLPRTLLHGDPHLGNWYITGEGRMGLCDWQCISAGHWSRDLAYALATVLSVDQRRLWEDELIASYLDQLAAAGGDAVTKPSALSLYRQQLTGALAMWTTTLCPPRFLPDMQPTETSIEMLRRVLTAIDDHVLDGALR